MSPSCPGQSSSTIHLLNCVVVIAGLLLNYMAAKEVAYVCHVKPFRRDKLQISLRGQKGESAAASPVHGVPLFVHSLSTGNIID